MKRNHSGTAFLLLKYLKSFLAQQFCFELQRFKTEILFLNVIAKRLVLHPGAPS